jgi:uncharacterized protein
MHFLALGNLATMLGLGAALGFFGGMFGIGGGILAIPLLVLVFGMGQAFAQGTVLVMMVPNLLIGWWRYSRHHPAPLATAAATGLLGAGTTLLVAHLATRSIAPDMLRTLFSGFLLVLALSMLVRQRTGRSELPASRLSPRLMPLVGLIGGAIMGLLGIGGGLVATPIFTSWFGQRQTTAQSLSLALVAPSSMIALLTYSNAQQVDWAMGLPLAIGGLFTVSAGVALAHRLPEQKMRAAFAWMLLCTALWMLVKPLLMH